MFLLPAVALVFAAGVNADATSFSQSKCFTSYGPFPTASISTVHSSHAITITQTIKSTLTPTSTLTPAPVSTTTTDYTTITLTSTLTQVTDTFSSTETFFATETDSTTVTAEVTAAITATTTSTPTSLIPTPAGFTPIFSYVASVGDTPAKRDAPAFNRFLSLLAAQAADITGKVFTIGSDHRPTGFPVQYPTIVLCTTLTEVISTATSTVTASQTVVTTAPVVTSVFTSTSTLSVTSTTSTEDASTTLTFSTTLSITTTTTQTDTSTLTTTTTTTSLAPAQTSYPACNTDNVLTYVNGHGIDQVYYGITSYAETNVASSTECCQQCFQQTTCAAWEFLYGVCTIFTRTDGTCTPTQVTNSFHIDANASDGAGFVLGNGACGQYNIHS